MADEQNVDQPVQYGEKAKQEAQGWYDAGVFDAFEGVVNNGLTKGVNNIVKLFFQTLGVLGVYILKGLYAALGELDPAFGAIAATVVGNMFEVDVNATAFASMTDSSSRKQVGHDVGGALLKAIQGDAAGIGAGELEPGIDAAQNFLGIMAHLAIEGWAMDLVGEAETLGYITNLGELNDRMASVLGLGRLSRTVLRPFVNAIIATPATWFVNKQYRPKMLTVPEAIAAWQRGNVDESTVDEIAARDGYGDDAIAALKQAAIKTLSPADAYFLERAGAWQQQDTLDELRLAGRDDARAQLERNLEQLRELHKFELELVTAAANAYAERKIDEPTLVSLLNADTIDTQTLARLHEVAAQRRKVNVQHLSRGDMEAAIENEIVSIADYTPWLVDRGYSHDDALVLELNLQAKLSKLEDAKKARELAAAQRAADRAAKLQAQQATRDRIAAEHAHWTGNLAEAERLVVRAIMPPAQYTQILIDHALSPGDASALTTVAVADRDARAAAEQKKAELAAKQKTPPTPIAALEHAVVLGVRPIDALRAELVARGYTADDVQLLVDLVARELADRQALQAKRDALAAATKGKQLAIGTLEQAVVDGAMTVEQYSARLTAAKYSATDVALLVAVLQQKVKDHAFAVERRALADAKLAASHVSLANEETAVVDGILTMNDFQQWLQAHGFDDGDVAVMTALLEEKLAKKAGA